MKKLYTLLLLMLFAGITIQAQQLHILHTSDMHSRIEPINKDAADEYAGKGGMARRVVAVKEYRTAHPDMLLFDSGDISQGTPYYNMFKGELEVTLMNMMHYDAMAIGNHEFDFGLDNMARIFRMADFPILCANCDFSATVLKDIVKRYTIIERDGVRIGVFGLSPQLKGLVQDSKCEGVVYQDPIAAANEIAALLKTEKQCDVVVCLSHLGYNISSNATDEELVKNSSNIDIVLGGHSHTFMEEPAELKDKDGKSVVVYHSGKSGILLGEIVMTLEAQ